MPPTCLSLLGPFMGALSKLSPFGVDMELSASLWLYLMALSLRLTIWKEGSKDFLVIGCTQAVARCTEDILVENGLAQMT